MPQLVMPDRDPQNDSSYPARGNFHDSRPSPARRDELQQTLEQRRVYASRLERRLAQTYDQLCRETESCEGLEKDVNRLKEGLQVICEDLQRQGLIIDAQKCLLSLVWTDPQAMGLSEQGTDASIASPPAQDPSDIGDAEAVARVSKKRKRSV
jgi:hypothetical protein